MDHSVAEEPVRADTCLRIGTVSQQPSVQVRGDLAGHDELGLGELFADWCEIVDEPERRS